MRDPAAFAREGYGRNAIAYRCVRLIAEAAASAPLHVGPEDHPLTNLLARPNPEQTGIELLEAFYGHLQVAGNAYLEAACIGEDAPSELYVLRPDRMSVIPGADGWPVGWEHRVGSSVRRFERDPLTNDAPILHLKLFNPADDWYGLSPMEAAAFSIDRLDQGNVCRIALYGGDALASVTRMELLDGANAFAIEADGEWELIQAEMCELVAPGVYDLSGFLRGRLGSAHAMRAPHAVGARIIKMDRRLARADVGAHEWGEALKFIAPPSEMLPTSARAEAATVTLPHAAVRPWAPAHVRAARAASGDVLITWVRCARLGGDSWGPGEPPVGVPTESYVLEVLDGSDPVRTEATDLPSITYSAAAQTADFGILPGSLHIRVAQVGESGATGLNTELTITL
ncbi:MAG: phage portal protein [Hyphomonadaceae bacterium]|nr:phage portal protein [Hyphomonadaceae bacterium]